MKQIIVDIDTAGNTTIDAVGFSGLDCDMATAFLEEAMGQPRRKNSKPERHQHSPNRRRNQQRLGQ